MFSKLLIAISIIAYSFTPAFSSNKIKLLSFQNPINILDIYGKRNQLNIDTILKNGDYLKSNELPAIMIFKDKTKICLSNQSSLKINITIDQKNVNFTLLKGNIFFSVKPNKNISYNFNFNSYNIYKLDSDFIFSKNKDLEIFNFNKVLRIHSTKIDQINILPYSNYKITKNGFLKDVDPMSKYNILKKNFLQSCLPEMTKKHINKINKSLRYKCSSHNGRLICGNQ